MLYASDNTSTGYDTKALFESNVTMPQLIVYQGNRIALGIRGSDLISTVIDDQVGPATPTVIGTASSGRSYSFDADNSGQIMVIDDLGNPAYVSDDGNVTWQAWGS